MSTRRRRPRATSRGCPSPSICVSSGGGCSSAILAIFVGFVVGWVFYGPTLRAADRSRTPRRCNGWPRSRGSTRGPSSTGVATPFILQAKVSLVAGIVLGQPDLALPDLGVHRPRPAPQRAQVDAALRRDRRAALPRRRRARLLRAAEGPRGAARASRPTRSPTWSTLNDYLNFMHPGPAGLRHRVRDPAVRGPAQPGRRRARPPPGAVAVVDHLRHVRLRRRGDAVDRPDHDAPPGGPHGARCS